MSNPLEPDAIFGEYRIVDITGRGGMGVVYRARQRRLNRMVALKVIADAGAQDPGFRSRFLRESRLAAAIDHPNIVSIFDADEVDGVPYIAMQWIDGETLSALITRQRAVEPRQAIRVVSQIAMALEAANARDLLHRDVKPANILVQTIGDTDHAYLTDFGIARVMSDVNERLTWTGHAVGTPGYQAPEQIRGENGDGRSDMYALGCVLFEALTGTLPFDGDNTDAIRWKHTTEPRPRPSSIRPELAPFDEVVLHAMALSPRDRFATNAQFARALRAINPSGPLGRARPAKSPSSDEVPVQLRNRDHNDTPVTLRRTRSRPLDVRLDPPSPRDEHGH